MENQKWVIIDLETGKLLHKNLCDFVEDINEAYQLDSETETVKAIDYIDNSETLSNDVALFPTSIKFLSVIIKGEDFESSILDFIKENGTSIECDLPYLWLLKVDEVYYISVHGGYSKVTRLS